MEMSSLRLLANRLMRKEVESSFMQSQIELLEAQMEPSTPEEFANLFGQKGRKGFDGIHLRGPYGGDALFQSLCHIISSIWFQYSWQKRYLKDIMNSRHIRSCAKKEPTINVQHAKAGNYFGYLFWLISTSGLNSTLRKSGYIFLTDASRLHVSAPRCLWQRKSILRMTIMKIHFDHSSAQFLSVQMDVDKSNMIPC